MTRHELSRQAPLASERTRLACSLVCRLAIDAARHLRSLSGIPHPRSLSVGGRQKLGRMPSPLLDETISCLSPRRSADSAPVLLLNVTPTRRRAPPLPTASVGPASS